MLGLIHFVLNALVRVCIASHTRVVWKLSHGKSKADCTICKWNHQWIILPKRPSIEHSCGGCMDGADFLKHWCLGSLSKKRNPRPSTHCGNEIKLFIYPSRHPCLSIHKTVLIRLNTICFINFDVKHKHNF